MRRSSRALRESARQLREIAKTIQPDWAAELARRIADAYDEIADKREDEERRPANQ
jgi:hypothetical protein